jgi:hypothetical protein
MGMTNLLVVPASVWITCNISRFIPQAFRDYSDVRFIFSTGCGKRCGKEEVLHTVCGNILSKITKLLGLQPNLPALACGKPCLRGKISPQCLWRGEIILKESTKTCGQVL